MVISHPCDIRHFVVYPTIKYCINAGPWDFLNLLKNAEVVISGSFHATVFSILFKRPFFAINGDTDNRISQLLFNTNLQNRSIHTNDVAGKVDSWRDINFDDAFEYVNKERTKAIDYLYYITETVCQK